MTVNREMPRYVCHKRVWALKIASVQEGTRKDAVLLTFHDDGYAPIHVDFDWYYRHKPEAGGYYVVYQDGYKSYSPAKVFEEGYTPQNAAHAAQAAPQAGEDARPVAPHLSDIEHPEQHARADSPESDGETFAAWLAREIPPGTVISNPAWWAPRILRAALRATPQPAAQAAPAVSEDTPEAIEGTIQVLKECGGFTEQAPVIRQLRRYATLLAALTTQGESHVD